jgi:hypothetical protein
MSSGRGQLVRLVSLEGSLIVVTSSHHQSVVDIVPTHFTQKYKTEKHRKEKLARFGSSIPNPRIHTPCSNLSEHSGWVDMMQ